MLVFQSPRDWSEMGWGRNVFQVVTCPLWTQSSRRKLATTRETEQEP